MNEECTCNAPLSDWAGYHGPTYGLHHREGCPLRMTFEEYVGEENEYDEKTGQVRPKQMKVD